MNNGNIHTEAALPRGPVTPRFARTKVQFETNVPALITLERFPPQQPIDGKWGEQYMYSLAGQRVAFVEPEVHEQLIALDAQPGQNFTVTKVREGRSNKWIVEAGDHASNLLAKVPAPAAAPAPPAPRPALEPPRSSPPPAVSTAIMQAALCSAIEATHAAAHFAESIGASYRASSEDVRALAITIYIEVTGSSHARKK
jgi:hypothetical protein